MKNRTAVCIGLFALAVMACEGKSMKDAIGVQKTRDRANVANHRLNMNQKVFFGHQSVGENIIDGIKMLTTEILVSPVDPDKIDAKEFEKPGLTHAAIGKNEDPLSKYEAFKNILDSGVGDRVDIAGMKLCYIDISSKTDVNDLFKQYKDMVKYVKNRYPKLKIIHIATPLTVKSNWVKDLMKTMIGKENIWKDANRNRIRYNNLLRTEYENMDPVFNLDIIEAFGSDPTLGPTIDNNYSLDERLASDWGHLNDLGKKTVAGEFIRFLENTGKSPSQ